MFCWFWQYCSFHPLPSFSSCHCWMRNTLSPPSCYVWRESSFFGFILFPASLKMPLLSDWGEEMNVFVLETSKIHGFLCLLQELVSWLNLVYGSEKLFPGTLLACRSDWEQQVLTTGFPPMLMPLWFAGFGNCFCLPAFHRSPQHMEPSCDFTRCVGGRAVCC